MYDPNIFKSEGYKFQYATNIVKDTIADDLILIFKLLPATMAKANLEERYTQLLEKHNTLVSELRARVECPVCLVLPTEGPMASCPKGHLVCIPCHRTMATQALVNCPNCREPMGNTMSLLAKTVIENIEHECNNEGCNKMMLHKELVKHKEELCDNRKVLCPELGCNQIVSLSISLLTKSFEVEAFQAIIFLSII